MVTTRNEYEQRKDEILKLFKFIELLETKEARLLPNDSFEEDINRRLIKVSVDTISILRSSFYLVLYNCVESTTTNCLTSISTAIKEANCLYSDLREELRLLVIAANERKVSMFDVESTKHINDLKDAIETFCAERCISLDLNDYIKSSSQGQYSGSLDCRVIKKLFCKFGMDTSDWSCDCLKTIKENRNKLAHGEVSFQECCRDYPIMYMKDSMNEMFLFFDKVLLKTQEYIENQYFLMPSIRKKTSYSWLRAIIDYCFKWIKSFINQGEK